jgi:hypothetical protein
VTTFFVFSPFLPPLLFVLLLLLLSSFTHPLPFTSDHLSSAPFLVHPHSFPCYHHSFASALTAFSGTTATAAANSQHSQYYLCLQ